STNIIQPPDQSVPASQCVPLVDGHRIVGLRCFTAANRAWLIWLTSEASAAEVRWVSISAAKAGNPTASSVDITETVTITSIRVKPFVFLVVFLGIAAAPVLRGATSLGQPHRPAVPARGPLRYQVSPPHGAGKRSRRVRPGALQRRAGPGQSQARGLRSSRTF